MVARDIMTQDVLVLTDYQQVVDAIRLLYEHQIGGAPVIDENGRLVGIVTKTDIVETVLEQQLERLLADDSEHLFADQEIKEAYAEDAGGELVRDVMTHDPVTTTPDTSLGNLARIMLKEKIHRVIIVDKQEVIGLVSAMDMLKYFTSPA